MIITSLYLDNVFTFCDTQLDLTYKRPLAQPLIANEHIPNCPKFYVKKVCVLSGTNASGKTSLGRLLWLLQTNLATPYHLISQLEQYRYDKTKPLTITLEFVTVQPAPILHWVKIKLSDGEISFQYRHTTINKTASVKQARDKLNKQTIIYSPDTIANLLSKSLAYQGWFYLFSENQEKTQSLNPISLNPMVLKAVLQTFDNSISDVLLSQDDKGINGFNIHFDNGDNILVDKSGHIAGASRLSRGTYDAVMLAYMVCWVMNEQGQGTSLYYLDEKMAFSHSELEQTILNLLIDKLSPTSQLFYSTHNYDILDMNLPIHSYVFLSKQNGESKFVQPEHSFKKNDRSLLNHIKNNVFNTLPNTSKIDKLLWEM